METNNPNDPNAASEPNEEPDDMSDPNRYRLSAADRAHGTHGRGRTQERRLDEPVVDPGVERGLGEPGWGSEAAGGSSIDKRSPKK